MLKTRSSIFLLIIAVVFTSCVNKKQEKQKAQECNQTWFDKVESKIPTGDEHGHGPDIGSDEWKSVVEHRMGIKGNKIVPSIKSKEWCSYIDRILFKQ